MRHRKFFPWALGILALSIFLPLSVLAAPAGKFSYLMGRVDITSPGQAARPAHVGDAVAVGDIIRAKSGSRAEITFVDGNILRLAQNTRVEVTEYMVGKEETKGALKLFRGKIQNIVKRVLGRIFGRGKKNRFEVHTPTAVCGVRGTNFFTWYTNGVSGAAFQEGQGYGYSVGQPEAVMQINAGERMLVLGPGQRPIVMFATDFELQQHWMETAPADQPPAEEPATEPAPGLGAPENLGDIMALAAGGTEGLPDVTGFVQGGEASENLVPDLPPEITEAVAMIAADTTTPWQVSLQNLNWSSWVETDPKKPGTWKAEMDGTYAGPVPDDWTLQFSHVSTSPERELWAEVLGSEWNNDTAKSIAGKVTGAWVNLDDALTGVLGGALINGTFDPTLQTWEAQASGSWLETVRFYKMAKSDYDSSTDTYTFNTTGKGLTTNQDTLLNTLNIPCIEIGRTNLSGKIGAPPSNHYLSVTLHDVTFFAYSTGDASSIWATHKVTGEYKGTPDSTWKVKIDNFKETNLSNVSKLKAFFEVQQWDKAKKQWVADITKGNGKVGGHKVTFNGAAAGTIDNLSVPKKGKTVTPGTFSGTGAGVVKP
ncbi:MAG: FecR family protein [Desulfobacteraceae bacterium]|jgi:hypothetical protein